MVHLHLNIKSFGNKEKVV